MLATRTTAKDWDDLRTAFASSILVDTSLNSLAQNLEGAEWPLKSKTETPAHYIDFTYEEVVEMFALKGQPPARIDQLAEILRETLAFDAPFGDMVAQSETTAAAENAILKNLARLGVPPEFPVALTALGRDTLEFCQREGLTTLSGLAIFAQGMAQTVIVGGDFRTLLNALSHIDEKVLALVLPFRAGTKGLHLVEGLGLAIRGLPEAPRLALARRLGHTLTPGQTERAAAINRDQMAAAEEQLRVRADAFFSYFAAEAAGLRSPARDAAELRRLVRTLDDPVVETLAVHFLNRHLRGAPARPAPIVAPAAVAPVVAKAGPAAPAEPPAIAPVPPAPRPVLFAPSEPEPVATPKPAPAVPPSVAPPGGAGGLRGWLARWFGRAP